MSNCHRVVNVVAALMLCHLLASAAAAQQLDDLYRLRDAASQSYVEYHRVTVPKGKEVVLADLKGPGKVTYFYVTPVSDMVLKIFWDDESEASVLTPLGDFFGALRGKAIDYQSLPMQIQHGCYMCYLPMPFSKRARFVLANDSEKDYSAEMAYGIDYEQDQQYAAEKSRLHGMWRRSNPVAGGGTAIRPPHQAFPVRREEQHRHATHDPGGKRPRPLRGQLPACLYQECRLVGRGHHDFPPGRQDHGPYAGNRG